MMADPLEACCARRAGETPASTGDAEPVAPRFKQKPVEAGVSPARRALRALRDLI